jgi:glycosyltransferase involved in cell wall biosynthesis
VVDDGSTDDTRNVVQEIARSASIPIDFVAHQASRGAAARRNEGVDRSEEDIVAFLDSDDAWLPRHLEVSLALLAQGADMTLSGFEIHGPHGVRTFRRPAVPEIPIERPLDLIVRRRLDARTSTFVVSRDAFGRVRFDDALAKHQDWDFVARAAGCIRVHDTSDVTVAIHETHEGRMSDAVDHDAFERFYARHASTLARRTRFALLVRSAWSTLAAEGRSPAFWRYWRRAASVVAPQVRHLALWLAAPVPGARAARRWTNRRRLARASSVDR